MSASTAQSAPAAVRPLSLDRAAHRSFLADVVVEHGPIAELNRLFLTADTTLREKGVRLSLGTAEELIAANRLNPASWSPIVPLFDPSLNDLDDRNCYALLGRSASGDVVTTVAGRLYELEEASLADEIESLRFFYRDPDATKWPGESASVSSVVARETRGRAIFAGAAWVHPEWRKLDLMDAMAPIGRALGLTRWMPNLTFSFMVPQLVKNGTAKRWRMNVDWGIELVNTPVWRNSTVTTALSWTTPERMRVHFADFVASHSSRGDAEVDGGVVEGPADQKLTG